MAALGSVVIEPKDAVEDLLVDEVCLPPSSGSASSQETGAAPGTTTAAPISSCRGEPVDDPLENGEVIYKSMEWWHVGLLMIAETISLGILSLPTSVAHLGLVPGVIIIIGLGIMATWGGYVIGQFKLKHPKCFNFADAGRIMGGPFLYHTLSMAAILSFVFIMAAHILTFSVAMNAITGHATCTITWCVVGFVLSFFLTLPRTLKNVSFMSMASCISILMAVLVVMIAVGSSATPKGALDGVYTFLPSYMLTPAFNAILNICIAFMGSVAYFGFISELREPRDFIKALALQQVLSITLYVVVGCILYAYIGNGVVSPALGSAPPLVQKIAYGLAMPTIIVAGVINAHVSIKQTFMQFWNHRGHSEMVASNCWTAWISWTLLVGAQWAFALVLALAIPVFQELLALISALFGSWFTYGMPALLWVNINWDTLSGIKGEEGFWRRLTWRLFLAMAANVVMLVIGMILCGLGIYTSGKAIADNGGSAKSFSCADNVHFS